MTGKERMEAIFAGGADRCGFWHGNPHADTTEIYYPYFGVKDDMELSVKLGDDFVWINADRGWNHPAGKPMFDVLGGKPRTHPLQALATDMDAKTLTRKYKGQLVFIGGVDTQQLLPFGTPDQVRAEVQRLKALFGPQYVVSPSHEALLPNVSVENLLAMVEAAQEAAQE